MRMTPDINYPEPSRGQLVEEIEADVCRAIVRGAGSGRSGSRYRDPQEAIADDLCDAVDPYFDRLIALLKKGDDERALILCQAIIVAMYRIQESEDFEVVQECAPEYPEETADFAACLWRTAGDVRMSAEREFSLAREIPKDFVKFLVPKWDWLLKK